MEDDGPSDLAITLLKLILVMATFPVWGPFVRALWKEFTDAMRADGGLWGQAPTPRQRREIEADIEAQEDPRQVHEPIAHWRSAQGKGPGAPRGLARSPDRAASPPRGGVQTGIQPRRFHTDRRPAAGPPGRPRFR